jgi:hypothetical protein
VELLVVLFLVAVYIVLSIAYITSVAVKFPDKPYRSAIAIALVILLPTWDMVLGAIVYFPSCLFFPEVAIYETAETDGIYYEGLIEEDYLFKPDSKTGKRPETALTTIGPIAETIRHGYGFVEGKIPRRWVPRRMPPSVYRCHEDTLRGKRIAKCMVVNEIRSRYMVKYGAVRIGTAAIGIVKIIDRSTGRLMAKERALSYYYTFPFFYWLYQFDAPAGSISCYGKRPSGATGTYDTLAFDVLKLKK